MRCSLVEKGKTMSECMMFPNDWAKFLEDYSFRDDKEVYTNGSRLIPTFRVEQMMQHYLRKAVTDNNVGSKWIPVTERLPERGQEVIVFSGGYLKPNVFAYHFWSSEFNSWQGITHWMPMPEMPREDAR